MLRSTFIDELGYLTLKPEQVNAFFKLMGERYGKKSTILTSNLDYPEWYDLFQRKTLVDALLDRLKHYCITIRINGPLCSSGHKGPNADSIIMRSPLVASSANPLFWLLFTPHKNTRLQ